MDDSIGEQLNEAVEDLQQQMRPALRLGIAKDGRRLMKRKPLPAQDGLSGFPERTKDAASVLNQTHVVHNEIQIPNCNLYFVNLFVNDAAEFLH